MFRRRKKSLLTFQAWNTILLGQNSTNKFKIWSWICPSKTTYGKDLIFYTIFLKSVKHLKHDNSQWFHSYKGWWNVVLMNKFELIKIQPIAPIAKCVTRELYAFHRDKMNTHGITDCSARSTCTVIWGSHD